MKLCQNCVEYRVARSSFPVMEKAGRVGRLTLTVMSGLDKWSPPPLIRGRQNSAYRTTLDWRDNSLEERSFYGAALAVNK